MDLSQVKLYLEGWLDWIEMVHCDGLCTVTKGYIHLASDQGEQFPSRNIRNQGRLRFIEKE